MFRPSAQCIIRERIALGVFDVVVAPRGNAKTVVVVPKTHSEEWRGYAFSEQVSCLLPSTSGTGIPLHGSSGSSSTDAQQGAKRQEHQRENCSNSSSNCSNSWNKADFVGSWGKQSLVVVAVQLRCALLFVACCS